MTFATATLVFEVPTGGNDNNGGGFDPGVSSPGTDYSQQASAQVAFTDLVIGGAGNTNKLTSAAHPFGATSPGNVINITGGTGFTTGLYRILSVSGTTATMDNSVGTASSTGGTGNLGGAFATVNQATTNMTVGGQITYVKGGTYSTASINSPTLTSNTSLSRIIGYTSTRGDNGQATIQLNASGTLATWTGNNTSGISLENLVFDGNNKSSSNGFNFIGANSVPFVSFSNCIFERFKGQYCIQIFSGALNIQGCEFASNAFTTNLSGCVLGPANSDASGATGGSCSINVSDSYFNGNTISSTNLAAVIWAENVGISVQNCVIYNNTGTKHDGILLKDTLSANISNTAIHANGRHGIKMNSFAGCIIANIQNNIITSNGGWGIDGIFSSTPTIPSINHNAYYNNTSGAKTGFTAGIGEVTLTGLPYVNAPTDFSLNSTVGQGLACRIAATPGTIGVSSVIGTGYFDIGPFQHQGPTSAYAYTFVS